jgi:formylglycine-generating enzyme required for sulfatase activity
VVVVLGGVALAWGATRGPPPTAVDRRDEVPTTSAVVTKAAPTDGPPEWFRRLDPALRPATIPKGIVISQEHSREYVNAKDGSVLLFVPGGTFTMGDPGFVNRDQRPMADCVAHHVELSSYFIGKYEVTRGQFSEFVKKTQYRTAAEKNPTAALVRTDFRDPDIPAAFWRGGKNDLGASWKEPQGAGTAPPSDDHPIVQVTWDDARAYCEWAGLALPTEAQWERAAAWDGRSTRLLPWGHEKVDEGGIHANLRDHSMSQFPKFFEAEKEPLDDKYPRTAPVGKFPLGASQIGALDMAGNVSEWCRDVYDSRAYSRSRRLDPCFEELPTDGKPTRRVMRGGSWNSPIDDAGTIYRAHFEEASCADDIGFRVARSIP